MFLGFPSCAPHLGGELEERLGGVLLHVGPHLPLAGRLQSGPSLGRLGLWPVLWRRRQLRQEERHLEGLQLEHRGRERGGGESWRAHGLKTCKICP